ncbi:hypothetical protein LJB77_02530 [Ruminococcaceae bacterium OttesenSCG-928-N02]|nr:hypothetical protein [Ruminococcaceae bacterium OttesenSCG-928-N02]
MMITLPADITAVMEKLAADGAQSYLIGEGLCRLALGLPVQEYKLVTTAEVEGVAALFPEGQAHGGRTLVALDGGWCNIRCSGTLPGKTMQNHVEKLMKQEPFTIFALAHNGEAVFASTTTVEDLQTRTLRFNRAANLAGSARGALQLFCTSAQLDLPPDDSSAQSALYAAVGIKNLGAGFIRAELQRALLSAAPERLQPLVSAGMLTFAGVGTGKLSGMGATPCTMLCRFWALLQRTQGSAQELCMALEYTDAFLKDLLWLSAAFGAPRPTTADELKRILKGGPPCPFAEFNELFEKLQTGAGYDENLFEKLNASGEAYAPEQLAVTPAMLAAAGVAPENVAEVHRVLFDAVFQSPALNHQQVLLKLAAELGALGVGV